MSTWQSVVMHVPIACESHTRHVTPLILTFAEHIAGTDDTTSNPGDGGGGGGRGVSAVNSITGSDHPQQGSSSSVERGGAVGGHGNGSTTGRKKRDSVGRGGIGEQSILDADEVKYGLRMRVHL